MVPHGVIARFVEAATAVTDTGGTAQFSQTMTLPTMQPIPQVAIQAPAGAYNLEIRTQSMYVTMGRCRLICPVVM